MSLPPKDWPLAEHSKALSAGATDWHLQRIGDKGPKLLFLHGTGASVHSWRDILPTLGAKAQTLAIDLPGQGYSPSTVRAYGLREMTVEIIALLEALDFYPDLIVGHSAGVPIALALQLDLPNSPKVFGISPALSAFGGPASLFFSAVARGLALTPIFAKGFSFFNGTTARTRYLIRETGSKISDEGIDLYRRLVANSDHTYAALCMMADWDLDAFRRRLRSEQIEALFWIGDTDRATPLSDLKEAMNHVKNVEIIVEPDAGHLLHEEKPERTIALVNQILDSPKTKKAP
ncbi:MAG: alpha/beta fold hydrolase BchO [Pseudomonadota bacterium]